METRPRIKLALSQLDKNMELTSKILFFVMWALTVYSFLQLPGTIPVHFNASGQADGYGNKMTLLVLPVVASTIYLCLTQLNKYPHFFNYIRKITPDNAQQQYRSATRMLRFMTVSVLVIFTLLILFTYLTSMGVVKGLGTWFLPSVVGILVIVPLGSIVYNLRK